MLKLATIGTGFIVDMYLDAVSKVEGIELYACYSRKEETGRKLLEKFNGQKVYTNLDEMLRDDAIDCVYVASPNSLHYEHALKALQAKKHVICEKPFTSTVAQFEHLVETAKANDVILMEAIISQHLPNFKEIKNSLSKLGTLRMVQCNFSQYSSRYDAFLKGETPNVFTREFCGGALSDINIYNLHFCVGLFGMPKTMQYLPNIAHNGIDTSGIAILEYDGFKAVCVGCKDTRSENMAQIQGELGYLKVNSEVSHMKHGFQLVTKESDETIQLNHYDNWMAYETEDFVHMIEQKDYDLCNTFLEESRMVMHVYETLRKNAGIVFPCDAQ